MDSTFFNDPFWSRHTDAVLLAYELQDRAYDAKVYPVTSANGSSVVVYGHSNGLTAIWRGGHKLTPDQSSHDSHGDGALATIPDEAPPNGSTVTNGDEEDCEEQDPATPFEPIRAIHDVQLNTAVRAIAVAPLPTHRSPRDTVPPLFNNCVVVAAVCLDGTVELVSLPLNPTSARTTTKAHGKNIQHNVQRVEVSGPEEHTGAPRGVALSYTSVSHDHQDEDKAVDNAELAVSHLRTGMWQLLIASHSWAATGLLAVSRLYLSTGDGTGSLSDAPVVTDFVHLENMATTVAFNPSRFPSQRHSQLLVGDTSGGARVYETAMLKPAVIARPTDPLQLQTKLLTTLFAPYRPHSNANTGTGRNKLLDVSWAISGRCVIALLDNGRWGIWDFSEAGPQTGQKRGHLGAQSVPGTGLTSFSIQGNLTLTVQEETAGGIGSRQGTTKQTNSALAPMTPKTRKNRQEKLFTAQEGGLKPTHAARGRISVSPTDAATGNDEDVVLSYGTDFFIIPKLMATWKRAQDAQKAQGSISGLATVLAPTLNPDTSLSTFGEMITSISQFADDPSYKFSRLSHAILISAEHRLVIWQPEKRPQTSNTHIGNIFHQPSRQMDEQQALQRVNQDQLKRGELGLGGVDRMLASMNENSGGGSAHLGNASPLAHKASSKRLTMR